MDKKNAEQLAYLRERGMSYNEIAERLSLTREQVRSYCRRHDISVSTIVEGTCPECGKPVVQVGRGRKRLFCCEACRRAWWKKHEQAARTTRVKEKVCACCGKPFKAYASSRKYCSHSCYITSRFGAVE